MHVSCTYDMKGAYARVLLQSLTRAPHANIAAAEVEKHQQTSQSEARSSSSSKTSSQHHSKKQQRRQQQQQQQQQQGQNQQQTSQHEAAVAAAAAAAAAAAQGGEEEEEAYQRLVKQDVVQLVPFVLFRCFDQVEHTEIVKVPVLFTICDRKVALGLAGFVDDFIDKFWRVFEGQLPHLFQDSFSQRRFLLHEVDVVVDPSHDKLIPNLQSGLPESDWQPHCCKLSFLTKQAENQHVAQSMCA